LTYKLCQIAEQLVIGCISLLLLLLFSLRQPLVFGAFVVAFAPFYPPRSRVNHPLRLSKRMEVVFITLDESHS